MIGKYLLSKFVEQMGLRFFAFFFQLGASRLLWLSDLFGGVVGGTSFVSSV